MLDVILGPNAPGRQLGQKLLKDHVADRLSFACRAAAAGGVKDHLGEVLLVSGLQRPLEVVDLEEPDGPVDQPTVIEFAVQ